VMTKKNWKIIFSVNSKNLLNISEVSPNFRSHKFGRKGGGVWWRKPLIETLQIHFILNSFSFLFHFLTKFHQLKKGQCLLLKRGRDIIPTNKCKVLPTGMESV